MFVVEQVHVGVGGAAAGEPELFAVARLPVVGELEREAAEAAGRDALLADGLLGEAGARPRPRPLRCGRGRRA